MTIESQSDYTVTYTLRTDLTEESVTREGRIYRGFVIAGRGFVYKKAESGSLMLGNKEQGLFLHNQRTNVPDIVYDLLYRRTIAEGKGPLRKLEVRVKEGNISLELA